jgi:hypothetical protein
MKRRKAFVAVALILLAGVGGTLYWAFLPYPWRIRAEARPNAKFKPDWQISEADFSAARKLVAGRLHFYEFISGVHVASETEIRIDTTARWKGPLAAAGRWFELRKEGAHWVVKEESDWIS